MLQYHLSGLTQIPVTIFRIKKVYKEGSTFTILTHRTGSQDHTVSFSQYIINTLTCFYIYSVTSAISCKSFTYVLYFYYIFITERFTVHIILNLFDKLLIIGKYLFKLTFTD